MQLKPITLVGETIRAVGRYVLPLSSANQKRSVSSVHLPDFMLSYQSSRFGAVGGLACLIYLQFRPGQGIKLHNITVFCCGKSSVDFSYRCELKPNLSP